MRRKKQIAKIITDGTCCVAAVTDNSVHPHSLFSSVTLLPRLRALLRLG